MRRGSGNGACSSHGGLLCVRAAPAQTISLDRSVLMGSDVSQMPRGPGAGPLVLNSSVTVRTSRASHTDATRTTDATADRDSSLPDW